MAAADFPGKIYGNKCVWDELWAARGRRRANLWSAPAEFSPDDSYYGFRYGG